MLQGTSEKSLLARLTLERHTLEQQLSSVSAEEQFLRSFDNDPPTYHPPPVLPRIKFRKTKILNRIAEFTPMIEAAKVRLDPIFKKLIDEDKAEESARVPEAVRDRLWEWWNRFEDLYEGLDTKGHDLTNKQWRILKGALKKIGRTSFEQLDSRFAEICEALAEITIA